MIKRCIEVSSGPAHLSVKDGQLLIRRGEETARIPVEDIGVVVVDNPAVTYTHAALSSLALRNVAVVICGGDHHPAGLVLPVEAHTVQAEAVRHQSEAGQRTRDRLWKELVSAKVANQSAMLEMAHGKTPPFKTIASRIRTGDPGNVEAIVAKRYWAMLFGKGFNRERDGEPPNNLLNYGYMVLRAAVARSICGAGLHPSLGLHHKNKYNAFALADDLMEPYRPMVDREVFELWKGGTPFVNSGAKARLLGVLSAPVGIKSQSSPLMVALNHSAASLRKALAGEEKKLHLPTLLKR